MSEETASQAPENSQETTPQRPPTIRERVIGIIREKYDPDGEILPEMTWADLQLDSLDTVELIMDIETEFNHSIPEVESERFATLGDALKYLEGAMVA